MSNNVSQKRSEASRLNGSKSKGPITEEGKSNSSKNSRKHGLYCSAKTMLSTDDLEEFAGFHKELYQWFAPTDSFQIILVEKIIAALWRRSTFEGVLTNLLQITEKHDEVKTRYVRYQREIEGVFRIMRSLDRTVDSSKKELKALQSEEKQKTQERTQGFDPGGAHDLFDGMLELRKNDLANRVIDHSIDPEEVEAKRLVAQKIRNEPKPSITDGFLGKSMISAMKNPRSAFGDLLNRVKLKYPNPAYDSDPLLILPALYQDAAFNDELIEMMKES